MRKVFFMFGTLLIFVVLFGMAYVRVSPLDEAMWHTPVSATENADLTGGAVRVMDGDAETLAAFDKAILAEPRTHVLAGSVRSGHITYVTRSLVFGFPDMTTAQLVDGQLRIFARLRFGSSDLGVNRSRLERVIAAIQ